jgi:hypothetical protein
MYTLKSMKLLIELLSNGNEDVQEQASYTIGYAVFGEDNMKDFRRLGGVDSLLECFASPSKGVQQACSFAMSQAAFDFEVRREMRAKDGIRPLAKLLQSDDAKVVEQAMMAVANLALDVPTKQAIAVLGGMGFCAGLLSSSDVPVQANACLAVGRLVCGHNSRHTNLSFSLSRTPVRYDFNSASEFNDKDGASLLTEILSSYVATADKWEAALKGMQDKGDSSRPDGIDEPDANLGQALLACGRLVLLQLPAVVCLFPRCFFVTSSAGNA